jgi:hypothetical protein
VNTLNKIGGVILLLGLAAAVVIGFQSPTGRAFWDGLWQAVSSVLRYLGDQIGRLNGTAIAGNLGVSVAVAAIAFLLTIALVPALRAGRNFAIMAVVFTVIAFILYNPSIVSGVGG